MKVFIMIRVETRRPFEELVIHLDANINLFNVGDSLFCCSILIAMLPMIETMSSLSDLTPIFSHHEHDEAFREILTCLNGSLNLPMLSHSPKVLKEVG